MDKSPWNVKGKADIHVHTMYSGVHRMGFLRFPESVADPADVVRKAKECGMDVVCVTDHNSIQGALCAARAAEQMDGIEVVVGEEITTLDGEVLALFIREEIPADLSAKETIRRIRAQGGLVIAPHPFSLHCPCLKDRIDDMDLDGIEVLNGGHIDDFSNPEAARAAESGKWARMGGSDSHHLKTIGSAYTEFEGRTAEDLRRAILDKATSAGGKAMPMVDAIAWSVGVVVYSDLLILRTTLGLERGEHDDPIHVKVRNMTPYQKVGALVGSLIYLTPPVPFLCGMTSRRLFRKLAADERANGQTVGPVWPQ